LKEAIAILENEMPEAGAKPDLYCYRQILRGCEKIGHTKLAFKYYNKVSNEILTVSCFHIVPISYYLIMVAIPIGPNLKYNLHY